MSTEQYTGFRQLLLKNRNHYFYNGKLDISSGKLLAQLAELNDESGKPAFYRLTSAGFI